MKHPFMAWMICVLLCSCSVDSTPDRVDFYDGSWAEVLKKARRENKYIYLDAVTQWCGPCKQMDKEAFADADVAAFVHERFIPVKMDMEKGEGLLLRTKYRVNVFPTHLVFDSDGSLLFQETGWLNADDFCDMLDRSLAPAQHAGFKGVSSDIALDYPAFLREALSGKGRPADSVVSAYLDANRNWLDEVSWTVIYWYASGERIKRFVLDNRDTLETLFGERDIENKVHTLVNDQVRAAIARKDEVMLDSALAWMERESAARPGSMFGTPKLHRLRFYEETRDWEALMRFLQADIDEPGTGFSAGTLNNVAFLMYRECEDPECLTWAVNVMRDVVEKKPRWQFIDTYAGLLFKTGRLEEAEAQARRALKAAKKAGEDAASTRELLENILRARKTESPDFSGLSYQ